MKIPRRRFVRRAFLTSGAAWLPWADRLLCGSPLGLAVGVQLWSVREQLKENLDGTLHQLTAIGYREVELFETPKSPGEFRRKVEDAGLKCVSGHFELKDLKDPATIGAAQQLGLTYMILVFPALPSLEGQSVDANFGQFVPRYDKISLSDYKWNAEPPSPFYRELRICCAGRNRRGMLIVAALLSAPFFRLATRARERGEQANI
jgi:hypothetical protein